MNRTDDNFMQNQQGYQSCDRILDTNDYEINGLFFKGGALGYRARLSTIRNDWISAIKDAKTALEILQKSQQIAPFIMM